MNSSEFFFTMTDDQLAEWHQNVKRIDQLQRDLDNSRKATEAIQEAANAEYDRYRGELSGLRDAHLELTMKYNDARSGLRRSAAESVQLLTALRRLVAAVEQFHQLDGCGEARGVLDKITREAKEVLTLLEIPF